MTTYSWNATYGEWNAIEDWTNDANPADPAVPTAADIAKVDNGGIVFVAPSDTTAAAQMLQITDGDVIDDGELQLDGLKVGTNGLLTVNDGVLNVGYQGEGRDVFNMQGNVIVENKGVVTVGPYLQGKVAGTVTLNKGGEYVFDGAAVSSSHDNVVDFNGGGATFADNAQWNGAIEDFNSSDGNALAFGSSVTSFAFNAATNVLAIQTLSSGSYRVNFTQNSQSLTQSDFVVGAGGASLDYSGAPVCFAAGVRIRTISGDVAVEALQVGHLAVTASGERRPIRWLGHRRVDCRKRARPEAVLPVRIAAGAFGPNKPSRDLIVSPGHAIGVDVVGEALIPAIALVNGATIQQLDVDDVVYWHVELDSHDCLVAENLPAESYFDAGNREFFSESDIVQFDLTAEAEERAQENFCRPFHKAGVLVEAVRSQLGVRARALGWTLQHDPLADLHLLVDGRRVEPEVSGRVARFSLAHGGGEVWLASTTARPVDASGADGRTLGVCVSGLRVDADGAQPREIPLDDPALRGFHEVERDGDKIWRWTQGRARLPAVFDGPCVLTVDLGGDAPPHWVAPLWQGRARAA